MLGEKMLLEFKKIALVIAFFLILNFQSTHALKDNKEIKHQISSEHFDFYSTDYDVAALKDLEKNLEKNYLRVTKDFQANFTEKIKINIYPNIKSFHVAIKMPDAPDWLVGTGGFNELKMVSPLNPGGVHSYDTLMKTIVHEFVHVVTWNVRNKTGGIPKWLSEGIAYYEAGQFSESYRRKIKYKISENNIPTFKEMETAGSVKFGDIDGYGFSTTAIEFIIKKYDISKVISLIKYPNQYIEIFGLSKEELEKEWMNYLKTFEE
jgi:Peptidase MA superfamily